MGKRGKILREKGDDFNGRRRRFRGRRVMILNRGEGKDLEGGGGRLGSLEGGGLEGFEGV